MLDSSQRPPERTALLVIDVQDGLFHKSTPIYQAEALLGNIRLLVERAHQTGTQVIYIQHSSDKVLPWGSPEWQLHPSMHLQAEDLLVHKQHGNAFEDTPLDGELRARNIQRLVISGLVTHGCVKATCQGALVQGYQVILVQDAHSSYSKDAARLIEEWNGKLKKEGAELRPARDVFSEGY
jgi:nicotinamidase-related amidase